MRSEPRHILSRALLLLLPLMDLGCSRPSPSVILLGVDGMDPTLTKVLVKEGRLPNIEKMMKGGAYTRLKTLQPITSPQLWTTVATGKLPERHGILGWVKENGTPYSNSDRKVSALWEILSEKGKRVLISNFLFTHPPDEVNGYIIHNREFPSTWPPQLLQRFSSIHQEIEGKAGFLKHIPPEARIESPQISNDFIWDEYHYRVFTRLYKKERFDLSILYIRGIDDLSHLYPFRFLDVTREMVDLMEYIKRYYEYVDGIAGRILGMMRKGATFIICSDHGFTYHSSVEIVSQIRFGSHSLYGILFAFGGGIREDGIELKKDIPRITDIAPTLLYASGLPVARDMDGSVIEGLFDEQYLREHQIRLIETYEVEARKVKSIPAPSAEGEKSLRERLKALGYIE